MPSTRTGQQYSARLSMPSSPTLRQGSYISFPSSMTSTSVLRKLPPPLPYRWQEQIPNITLPKYGRTINDDDDYEDLMAILFPQSDLYSRTITMRHLWITAQKLRREADRQEIEARRLFMELEGLGLQQVLCPHQNKPPWESFSLAAWLPTPYYPTPSQETRSPTPPPTSPPLGAPGNLIIIEDDDEELDGLDNNFYTAESTFSTQSPSSYIVKNALIDDINTLNVHNTYAITATNEHWDTECLIVQNIEASDFNHSGGYCYELFFFSHTCLPCSSLLFFIYDQHAFTSRQTCLLHMFTLFLQYALHVFASRLTHSLYLFKPVVRQLYSLAFH